VAAQREQTVENPSNSDLVMRRFTASPVRIALKNSQLTYAKTQGIQEMVR
jgi:hypothetical protein